MKSDFLDTVVTFLARGFFFPRASTSLRVSSDSSSPSIPAAPLPAGRAFSEEGIRLRMATKSDTRAGIGIDRTVDDPIARQKILHDIAVRNSQDASSTKQTGNDIQAGAAVAGTAVGSAFGAPQAGAWVGKAVGVVSQPIAEFFNGQSMGGLTVDEQLALGLSDGSKSLLVDGEYVKVGGASGRLIGRVDQEG